MSHGEYNSTSIDAVLSRMEAQQKSNSDKLDKVLEENEVFKNMVATRLGVLEDFKKQLVIYGGIASVAVSIIFNSILEWWNKDKR